MSDVRVGPEDAGRTVEVTAGDRLLVSLPESAGTGHTWVVEALPDGVAVVGEHYEHAPGAGIGATSRHVFVLSAAPGTLRLRHGQPWRGEAGITERYEVTAVPAPPR